MTAFFPILALATDFLDIVINEIAWMGTKTSYNDEWIELYNNLSFSIDINGWKLTAKDGTPEVILKGKIPPKGFFLLERTDDTTLPDIKADLIYKGNLNNEGEYLKLLDLEGKIIDEINCSNGWFAGNNETKRTMERKDTLISGNNPENWQNSQNFGGTPKTKNSQGEEIKEPSSQLSEEKTQAEGIDTKKEIALVGEQVSRSKNPLIVFLIALTIAISSGIIVLFLKKRAKTDEQ